MIVTIDGPAGAGKSTVAKALAKQLGFRFLDTGAMYRVVTLAALRSNMDLNDAQQLAELANGLSICFDGDRVLLDDEDVSDQIRSNEITTQVRRVADNVAVRHRLIELQRQIAVDSDLVTEGRDQGTEAFPDAQCKIFLTASAEERAKRRYQDLQDRGENVDFEELLAQQNRRDQEDTQRQVGRLVAAPDAVKVVSDGLSLQQVVDRLAKLVQEKKDALPG